MSAATPSRTTEPPRRPAAAVAAGIASSRVAGLGRESLIVSSLGNTSTADAFRAATRIPNLLQNLLGEGTLSASFIPTYSRLLEEERDEEAARLAGAVAGLLAVLTGAIALAAVVLARPLTTLLAPGLPDEAFELTVRLVRIVTLGTGFLVLSAWCLGVLNSHRAFFLSYVAPVLWNLVQIVVLVVAIASSLSLDDTAVALAWALAAGGVVQMAVQLPSVLARTGPLRPFEGWTSEHVAVVRRRFGPAVLGRGATQIGAYLDLFLASFLAAGALAALAAAQILYLLPIGLFAMSVAAAELPELSRLSGTSSPAAVSVRVRDGCRRILFFVVFAAVAYLTIGELLIATLFEWRNFGDDDTLLVWFVLVAYAVGLPAASVSRLLQNTLFATGDVAGPARIALYRVVIAATVGVLLMFQLDRLVLLDGEVTGWLRLPAVFGPLPDSLRADGLPLRLGAVGLAVGSAGAAWFELHLLRQRVLVLTGDRTLLGRRLPAVVGVGGAIAVAGLAVRFLVDPLPALLAGPLAGAFLGSGYLLLTHRLGWPEAVEVTDGIRAAGRSVLRRRR